MELFGYVLIMGSDASLCWAFSLPSLFYLKTVAGCGLGALGKPGTIIIIFLSVLAESEWGLIKTCWVFNVGAY